MKGFREKCEKPPFLGILVKNDQFWKFLAKMGEMGIFFKKALGTFFSHLQALTNCKVSEKSNELFSSNSVTYLHTHARTHGRESLGLQRLRRETKNTFFKFFLLMSPLYDITISKRKPLIKWQWMIQSE